MNILPINRINLTSVVMNNNSVLQNRKISFASAPDTFEKESSDINPVYNKVLVDNRTSSKYGTPKASNANISELIQRMEQTFVLENGKPYYKQIIRLITKCRDDHYGSYVSIASVDLLHKVTDLKDKHNANNQAVEEILDLFNSEHSISNNLLNHNNLREGYKHLFEHMPEYIDANGDFNKYMWIKDNFRNTAESYSDFGKGPCYCFE